MASKQMIDIFYKSNSKIDLCELEKYMLLHTFLDTFKPAKNSIRTADLHSSWFVTDNDLNPSTTGADLNLHRFNKNNSSKQIDVSKPEIIINPIVKPVRTRFRSYLKDSLFWCMYVNSHGHTAFETHRAIGTNMLNLMMNEKKMISDFFNNEENRTSLKNTNHKITNVKINEIKCDLMTRPVLSSIEALIPCCVYWKCPIFVNLGNKTYLHFVPNNYVSDEDDIASDPNAVLLYIIEGRFEIEMDQEKKTHAINEMCKSYYKIPHYEKSLLSVGTYKTEELREIYEKIVGKKEDECCIKMKKQDYYNEILERCVFPKTIM